MCAGGDVGVYSHGTNAIEIELMVEYGMRPIDALKAATSGNAELFGLGDRIGRIAPGMVADLVAVEGNPLDDVAALSRVRVVYRSGNVIPRSEATKGSSR